MLPLTLLPTSESSSFLDGLDAGNSPVSRGEGETVLDTAFAAILGSSGLSPTPAGSTMGESLPQDGNSLPLSQGPLSQRPLPALAAAGPEEIVASLREQIARVFPDGDSPADGSIVAAEAQDGLLFGQLAGPDVDESLVVAGTDHAGAVDDRVPASSLLSGTANDDSAEIPVDPALQAKDSSPVILPPPARAQGVGSGNVRHGIASNGSRPAAEVAATPGTPLSLNAEETVSTTIDNRTAAATQNLALTTATPSADGGVESQGQARFTLAEIAGNTQSRTAAPPATTLPPIEVPVQDSAWDKAVSERVVMMAANKVQTAEIRLTPAELGPLRIQVSLEDGAAQVSFVAQHAVTRDALEQALPRLREMFTENGIQLGDARVDVDTADTHQQQAGSSGTAAPDLHETGDVDAEHDSATTVPVRQQRGLVDTFV